MTKHLEGKPVSAYTYGILGRRCAGCRQASTDKQRAFRHKNGIEPSQKVYRRSDAAAARWVREWHPEVWAAIVADEYQRVYAERKKVKR